MYICVDQVFVAQPLGVAILGIKKLKTVSAQHCAVTDTTGTSVFDIYVLFTYTYMYTYVHLFSNTAKLYKIAQTLCLKNSLK